MCLQDIRWHAYRISGGMLCTEDQPNWNDLPPELLEKIAQVTSGTEAMRGVSREWKRGLESVCTKLRCYSTPPPTNLATRFLSPRKLVLWGISSPPPTELSALRNLPALKNLYLKLSWGELNKEISEVLHSFSLDKLSLKLGCASDNAKGCSRAWVGLLEGLPLRSFHLHGADLSQAGLDPLRKLPLVRLTLGGRPVLGSEWGDIFDVVRGKSLKRLDIDRFTMEYWPVHSKPCHFVNGSSLKALSGMPLQALKLTYCDEISDEDLAFLKYAPISVLDITCSTKCKLTDATCKVMGSLPLEDLCLFRCDTFTHSGFSSLFGGLRLRNPLLRYLNLARTKFSSIELL